MYYTLVDKFHMLHNRKLRKCYNILVVETHENSVKIVRFSFGVWGIRQPQVPGPEWVGPVKYVYFSTLCLGRDD